MVYIRSILNQFFKSHNSPTQTFWTQIGSTWATKKNMRIFPIYWLLNRDLDEILTLSQVYQPLDAFQFPTSYPNILKQSSHM